MKRKVITQEELNEFLRKHKLWLKNEGGGEKADLSWADLSGADLSGADLSKADLSWADLSWANLSWANLSWADLSGADLSWADLSGANLSKADLDYSCLPLWCRSLDANFDDRQLKQIAFHLVKAGLQSNNASKETKTELAKIVNFANGFHRADKCGKIEVKDDEKGKIS